MYKFKSKYEIKSLVEACKFGSINAFYKLLSDGHSVHELSNDGQNLLSIVCSAGYFDLTLILLKMNVDLNAKGGQDGRTPLMEAASSGFTEIVNLLLSYSASVNIVSFDGNSSLIYACSNGHDEIVKLLLSCGANTEIRSKNGYTSLMSATNAGHISIVKILIQHGAYISTYCKDFLESALTLASLKGHLEIVKLLLNSESNQKIKIEHQVKPEEMFDALMNTAIDGHIEIAKVLFKSNAEINLPSSINMCSETPLTLAACSGHLNLTLLFIDHGAHIEEVNYKGYTPLMQACINGHDDIVFILLQKGAYINALSKGIQVSSLALACQYGFLYIADLLIRNGASVELGALTPLMKAAQIGNIETATYLLQCGANINAQTVLGKTALFYACKNGHTKVAYLLFQFGANLEHTSKCGYTPLMTACKAGHLSIVQFLISENTNMNQNTDAVDKHTALSLACAGGHHDIVKYLLATLVTNFNNITNTNTLILLAAREKHLDSVRQSINEFLPPNSIDESLLSIIKEQNTKFTQTWNSKDIATTSIQIYENLIAKRNNSVHRQKQLKDLMMNSLVYVLESKTKRF